MENNSTTEYPVHQLLSAEELLALNGRATVVHLTAETLENMGIPPFRLLSAPLFETHGGSHPCSATLMPNTTSYHPGEPVLVVGPAAFHLDCGRLAFSWQPDEEVWVADPLAPATDGS